MRSFVWQLFLKEFYDDDDDDDDGDVLRVQTLIRGEGRGLLSSVALCVRACASSWRWCRYRCSTRTRATRHTSKCSTAAWRRRRRSVGSVAWPTGSSRRRATGCASSTTAGPTSPVPTASASCSSAWRQVCIDRPRRHVASRYLELKLIDRLRARHVERPLILHWLRLPQQVDFKVAVTAFRVLHGLAPPYLNQLHRVSKKTTIRIRIRFIVIKGRWPLTHHIHSISITAKYIKYTWANVQWCSTL